MCQKRSRGSSSAPYRSSSARRFRPSSLGLWLLVLAPVLWIPSKASAQEQQPTSPIDSFVSGILKPLLDRALTSSEDSDANLIRLEQQIKDDNEQKKIDAEQRKKEDEQRQREQETSKKAFDSLELQAQGLQTFFDKLFPQLTSFSGSEEEKQAAALKSLNGIIDKAKAVEAQLDLFKGLAITGGIVAVGVGVAWVLVDVVIPAVKILLKTP